MRFRSLRWISCVVLASCSSSASNEVRQAGTLILNPTYMHAGFGAGPVVFTDSAGQLLEERRSDPFGLPIETHDLSARDLNTLNKRTDVATGWSDHGARWMVPATARWLTGDPPTKGPDRAAMTKPWSLHPYQYVDQNPVVYWDPDGNRPRLTTDQIRRGITANVKDAFAREAALDLLNPSNAAQRDAYRKTAENIAMGKLKIAYKMDIVAMRECREWDDEEGWWKEGTPYWSVGMNPNTQQWFVFATEAGVIYNGGTAFISEDLSPGGGLAREDMTRALVEADNKRLLDVGVEEDVLDLRWRYMRDTDARWISEGRPRDEISLILSGANGPEYRNAPGRDADFEAWSSTYEPGSLSSVFQRDD